MRAMSFALTTAQMLAGTKTVTRRLGWKTLLPGARLRAVEKAMGLRPGEKQRVLRLIEVVDVRVERVDAVTGDDVAREGFPDLTPAEFVELFCRAMRVGPEAEVRRIEFRFLD